MKKIRRARQWKKPNAAEPAVEESVVEFDIPERKGGPAVLIFDEDSVDRVVFAGTSEYDAILSADPADGVVPAIIPEDMGALDIMSALNSGEKRLLKSAKKIDGIEYRKISKR
jgi:hypothetical protein